MKVYPHWAQSNSGIIGVIALVAIWLLGTLRPAHATAVAPGLVVGQLQAYEDPSTTVTLAQILAQGAHFVDLPTQSPNYGFTASAYWLRIPVQNGLLQPATFYLDIKNPLLDYVTLYVVSADGLQATSHSGAKLPARQRPYHAPTLVLPFQLGAAASATLYLQIRSDGEALNAPFLLLTEAELAGAVTSSWILNSALLSILAAMLLYNFLLLLIFRTRLYFYYILYLFFGLWGLAALGGFGPAYLYPDNSWLGSSGLLVAASISLALLLMLMREFLALPKAHWSDWWARVLIGWAVFVGVGSLVWSARMSYLFLTAMTLIYPSFCFWVGIIALRRGQTQARLFILRQIFSWLGIMLSGLTSTGIVAYHPLIFQSPALGAVVDAILLSLALGERVRLLQRAQLAAEEQARRNLEIRSEELERLVAIRTAEIKTLQGILPICANCKKIRTDDGAWQQVESYISQHTDAQFSHGICTDCMAELYPDLQRKRRPPAAA